MLSRFNGILSSSRLNTNKNLNFKIFTMPKKADTAMKVFVMGMIGLTGYGAFALTNSLYKLKKFNREYNEKNKK